MYKHLYDSFKHWFHNKSETESNSVFFYADPHFGDDEMKQLRKTSVVHNLDIIDEEQVKRINSTIGKWGTIIILGDVGDVEWVKKIRAGRKVLIMGNHDKGVNNYKRDEYITLDRPFNGNGVYKSTMHDNKLFDEVYEGVLMISDKIMLSHEPVDFKYAYNIHGHDHANWFKGEQHLNVCAELINYTPVSLKQIVKSGVLKNIPNIHRETIDKAIERKKNKLICSNCGGSRFTLGQASMLTIYVINGTSPIIQDYVCSNCRHIMTVEYPGTYEPEVFEVKLPEK